MNWSDPATPIRSLRLIRQPLLSIKAADAIYSVIAEAAATRIQGIEAELQQLIRDGVGPDRLRVCYPQPCFRPGADNGPYVEILPRPE